MATFLTAASILPCKQGIDVNTTCIDSVNLYENYRNKTESHSTEKQIYGKNLKTKSANTQKIKESLKELEQLFCNYQCVHLKWIVQEPLLLFFNSGAIANITLDEKKTNIEKIVIDNSLCGKLASDHLTDVIFNDSCLLIAYSEPKLTYIHFNKQSSILPNKLLNSKKGKIIGFEPQITTIDLLLPCRRIEKKLSLNNLKDCMLIWWRFTSSDVWPWMPVNHSIERINFLVYTLNGNSFEILCSAKIHGELLHARFSKWHSNRINTLEEINKDGKFDINICTYEVSHGRCQCTSLSKLPLHARMTAFAWNFSEDKLLLSDQEMSLLVYDLNNNTTLITSTLFVVEDITWHPGGAVAAVFGANGIVQCFDTALNLIKFQSSSRTSVPLSSIHFHSARHPEKSVKILWQNSSTKKSIFSASNVCNELSDTLLIYFATGVLAFLKFSFGCVTKNALSPLELVSQYLKCGSIEEAVCLLQCLSWCQQSELCFQCLSRIANHLLKRNLCIKTESALEHALGTFYSCASSLPETVVYDYHQQIDHLARRFFHQLLRYHKFEKAYLLAVELQARDLFLDLHHVAKLKGESVLAVIAYKHAEQLDVFDDSPCNQSDNEVRSPEPSFSDKIDGGTPAKLTFPSTTVSISPFTPSFAYDGANKEKSMNFCENKVWNFAFPEMKQLKSEMSTPSHMTAALSDSKYCISNGIPAYNTDRLENIIISHNTSVSGLSDVRSAGDLPFPNYYSSELRRNSKKFKSLFPLVEKSGLTSNQIVEDEEEDVEGVPVKFFHFGIV